MLAGNDRESASSNGIYIRRDLHYLCIIFQSDEISLILSWGNLILPCPIESIV